MLELVPICENELEPHPQSETMVLRRVSPQIFKGKPGNIHVFLLWGSSSPPPHLPGFILERQ